MAIYSWGALSFLVGEVLGLAGWFDIHWVLLPMTFAQIICFVFSLPFDVFFCLMFYFLSLSSVTLVHVLICLFFVNATDSLIILYAFAKVYKVL